MRVLGGPVRRKKDRKLFPREEKELRLNGKKRHKKRARPRKMKEDRIGENLK